jgi:hypothetical protein
MVGSLTGNPRRGSKLNQRTQIICASGVNDDDALALFELGDDVVAVNRRQQQHGDGEKEPKPRQPVTLREKPGGIVRSADANFLTL